MLREHLATHTDCDYLLLYDEICDYFESRDSVNIR